MNKEFNEKKNNYNKNPSKKLNLLFVSKLKSNWFYPKSESINNWPIYNIGKQIGKFLKWLSSVRELFVFQCQVYSA